MDFKKIGFWLFLLLAIVLFGGCANNISRQAEEAKVVYVETSPVDTQAEDVMYKVFSKSELPWDDGALEIIDDCRVALRMEGKYISSIVGAGSSVPYYDYKGSVKRTYAHTMQLLRELTARSEQSGALTEHGLYTFQLLRKDVLENLTRQHLSLSAEEAKINKAANAADLADLKKLYDTMSPLIKAAVAL